VQKLTGKPAFFSLPEDPYHAKGLHWFSIYKKHIKGVEPVTRHYKHYTVQVNIPNEDFWGTKQKSLSNYD